MYLFIEKGKRGGISYIYNRFSKASNKYLKSYDPKQESKHIIYLHANNLYGYTMSKFFPTCGFKWIDPNEFDLNKYASNRADMKKKNVSDPFWLGKKTHPGSHKIIFLSKITILLFLKIALFICIL